MTETPNNKESQIQFPAHKKGFFFQRIKFYFILPNLPSQGSDWVGNAVVEETEAARLGANHRLSPVGHRDVNGGPHLFTGCEGGVLLLDGAVMVHFPL